MRSPIGSGFSFLFWGKRMGAAWLAMGLFPLILGAWLVARHGCRIEPGPPRTLGLAVIAWAWVTVGMEILGNLGRLDPPALVAWSSFGLVIGALLTWLRPTQRGDLAAQPPTPGTLALFATAIVIWAALRLGLVSFLHPVKVVSDGPIYHLYFAARWWKAGRIFPVATPFGEVGATYFWANGELWYAWLMTLYGGDRFSKMGQVPFLYLSGLAVGAIARRFQVGASAARLGAVWFVTIGPAFVFTFEPNVDTIMVAGYLLAVYFLVRGLTNPAGVDRLSLVLGSLAAGLGMGSKPTGIVFFPPLLLVALVLAVRLGGRGVRRSLADLVAIVVPAVAMVGYWPMRNAWLTGNPLYPIQVEAFGQVWLAGWFGPEAMKQSMFYVPREDWRAFIDIMLQVLDPRQLPIWLAAMMGLWAVGRPRRPDARDDRPTIDRWVWGFTALAFFNLAAYWVVIPYRTQQRFLFPALALFSIPLAKLLDRAPWIRITAVALLLVHVVTPQPWPFATTEQEISWDLVPMVPNLIPALIEIPLSVANLRQQLQIQTSTLWPLITLGVAALGAVGCWSFAAAARTRRSVWTRRTLAVAWFLPWVLVGCYELGGGRSIPFPIFRDYFEGWCDLDSRVGPKGARVAYAGNKIPYYLLGSKLQNDVQYINVDAHRDWLLHNYHRNAANVGEPSTWPNPFPGWDRLRPDYAAWLANLRAQGIEILVTTRVNIEEGEQNAADRDLFPIERVWADAHPAVFRPLYGQADPSSRIKIYQVMAPRRDRVE